MTFSRRKSGVYHEDVYLEDLQPQRRRRLSKPHTGSSTSLPSLTVPSIPRRRSMSRPGQEDTILLTPGESREALRSLLFSLTSDPDMAGFTPKTSQVALLAARFENTSTASTSQLSMLSNNTSPRKQILNRRTSADLFVSNPGSAGNRDQHKADDLGTVTPTSSLESSVDDAPPTRRTASFIPGAATRVNSRPTATIIEEPHASLGTLELEEKEYSRDLACLGTQEDWEPPPQADRPETPADLEYAHIGGLGLGSLRITNGAVSPTLSEMKALNTPNPTPYRVASSVYGGSVIGSVIYRKPLPNRSVDDRSLIREHSLTAKQDRVVHRAFSFQPGTESSLTKTHVQDLPCVPESAVSDEKPTVVTGFLAEDYIAELPMSPFNDGSEPVSPQLHSAPIQDSIPAASLQASSDWQDEVQDDTNASVELTPQGSVRRYEVKAHGPMSFMDEALAYSPETCRSNSPCVPEVPDSPISFFSAPEVEDAESFKSAIELQPARPRSTSPRKMIGSPLRDGFHVDNPMFRYPLKPKSDSGYSSNTSLSVAVPYAEISEDKPSIESRSTRQGLRLPFRKSVQTTGMPVLVRPTPSTKVANPSTAMIESASALTSTSSLPYRSELPASAVVTKSPSWPIKANDKARKKLKKQRRKSTVESAHELIVQRVASVECFDVPPVPNSARANLALRVEAIPELDKTYRTQEHTAHVNASVLTFAQPSTDLRFPSPEPVTREERFGRPRSQPRTRKRSLSRPRSWFGWSKEEKPEARREVSRGSTHEVNNFGSVVELLGVDPYDIAKTESRPQTPSRPDTIPQLMRRRTSPSNLSVCQPRPRSMMDDQSAQNFSRLRRLTTETKIIQRHSFDDRGGVPGRFPQPTHIVLDAPPLPPMPSAAEISRRYSYKVGSVMPPTEDVRHPSIDSERYEDDAQAPPPPPHSPRPEYIDHYSNSQTGIEDSQEYFEEQHFRRNNSNAHEIGQNQFVHLNEAPPAPSHSPHPMDITERMGRSRDISWSGPAHAWTARRESANAALQDTWADHGQYQHQDINTHPAYDENNVHEKQDLRYERGERPVDFSTDYYEDVDPRVQEQNYEPGYRPDDQSYANELWQHEQHYYEDQHRDTQQTEHHVRSSAQNSALHEFEEPPQPKLIHRHTWQPYSHELQAYQDPQSHRFYAEYNKSNVPRTDHLMGRRPQTFDELQPVTPAHPQQSRSRSRSRSRPVSRHSERSQDHRGLSDVTRPQYYEQLPSTRHPYQHARDVGRQGYNSNRYTGGFDQASEDRGGSVNRNHNWSFQKRGRGDWLDMDAYGLDYGGHLGVHR